jgi:hypothetical protein
MKPASAFIVFSLLLAFFAALILIAYPLRFLYLTAAGLMRNRRGSSRHMSDGSLISLNNDRYPNSVGHAV